MCGPRSQQEAALGTRDLEGPGPAALDRQARPGMSLGTVSAGGWPAGRRVALAPCSAGTLHTLGKGQVPMRGQPARGDGVRGLRSLLCNSGRSSGSFPSVGGRGLRVGPSDPRVPDPELFRFSQKICVCAHTHTPTLGSFDLPTVLTGREGFPTLSRRDWAQSWPSIEQRLRAGPLTQSHTQVFKTTRHKIYHLNSF